MNPKTFLINAILHSMVVYMIVGTEGEFDIFILSYVR